MPIYTKKGDKGRTSLFTGKKVSKTAARIEAIGTIDELNSTIGFTISNIKNKKSKIKEELIEIQRDLFEIGASLANPSTFRKLKILERVSHFEKFIDEMTEQMPKLSNFILPGGTTAASYLHIARTVCRRAERRLVALSHKERIDKKILVYINRLSDLFLTMSRFVNFKSGKEETIWKGDHK
ncbi:MAG: cob(I)yrinic acid a,c-diamide adenosyltransferase [Candidatus Levybacteria bacterium]|nr:cob(I)yrinic acid a,c-diamide adenosyltransferase [Candidatus Levybacteria bacterium]